MYIFIIFMYCVWPVLILNDCSSVVLSGAMSVSVWVVVSVYLIVLWMYVIRPPLCLFLSFLTAV